MLLNEDIWLICDHKWRDLPNLTLLNMFLKSSKIKSRIIAYKDALRFFNICKPNVVVLSQMWFGTRDELAKIVKKHNSKVIILNTEGFGRTIERKIAAGCFVDWGLCDLQLVWSTQQYNDIVKYRTFDKNKLYCVGFPRSDFYDRKNVNKLMSKQDFCKIYGLDIKKK